MSILKPACSVSPAWLWWWFFLLTLTEQSWSALSSSGTASSSPAPVSGPEGLLLPTFPLPPSLPLWSLCSFPYNSHCLAVSALFPLSSVKLMVSSHHPDSSHSLDFQTKPQHISASSSSFYSPCFVVWGCLPVDSEWEDEHNCILDSLRNVCQSCLEKRNISASVVYHDPSSEFT